LEKVGGITNSFGILVITVVFPDSGFILTKEVFIELLYNYYSIIPKSAEFKENIK